MWRAEKSCSNKHLSTNIPRNTIQQSKGGINPNVHQQLNGYTEGAVPTMMEYYSTIKRKDLLPKTTTWLHLENTMLCARSHTLRSPTVWVYWYKSFRTGKSTDTENTLVADTTGGGRRYHLLESYFQDQWPSHTPTVCSQVPCWTFWWHNQVTLWGWGGVGMQRQKSLILSLSCFCARCFKDSVSLAPPNAMFLVKEEMEALRDSVVQSFVQGLRASKRQNRESKPH